MFGGGTGVIPMIESDKEFNYDKYKGDNLLEWFAIWYIKRAKREKCLPMRTIQDNCLHTPPDIAYNETQLSERICSRAAERAHVHVANRRGVHVAGVVSTWRAGLVSTWQAGVSSTGPGVTHRSIQPPPGSHKATTAVESSPLGHGQRRCLPSLQTTA